MGIDVVGDKRLDCADIDIVRVAVPGTVMTELGVPDRDGRVRVGVDQDAVLIVLKQAIGDGEVSAALANASSIGVRHRCAGKCKSIDRDRGIVCQQCLAVGRGDCRDHRNHATLGNQVDAMENRREVVCVGPCLHCNRVARRRRRCRRADCAKLVPGPLAHRQIRHAQQFLQCRKPFPAAIVTKP